MKLEVTLKWYWAIWSSSSSVIKQTLTFKCTNNLKDTTKISTIVEEQEQVNFVMPGLNELCHFLADERMHTFQSYIKF